MSGRVFQQIDIDVVELVTAAGRVVSSVKCARGRVVAKRDLAGNLRVAISEKVILYNESSVAPGAMVIMYASGRRPVLSMNSPDTVFMGQSLELTEDAK